MVVRDSPVSSSLLRNKEMISFDPKGHKMLWIMTVDKMIMIKNVGFDNFDVECVNQRPLDQTPLNHTIRSSYQVCLQTGGTKNLSTLISVTSQLVYNKYRTRPPSKRMSCHQSIKYILRKYINCGLDLLLILILFNTSRYRYCQEVPFFLGYAWSTEN